MGNVTGDKNISDITTLWVPSERRVAMFEIVMAFVIVVSGIALGVVIAMAAETAGNKS